VFIQPGADLYLSIERWIAERGYAGAAFRLIQGAACELDLMTGKPDDEGRRVATFHGPHPINCPARVLGGHGTIGAGRDGYVLHTHAIFLDAEGVARGCHVVRGRCIAGDEGIELGIFPVLDAQFRILHDAETIFDLFYPESAMTSSVLERHEPKNRVLLVKLQPNQDVYAGLESACRDAGFRGGLVLSGVGSLNEAWILRTGDASGTSVHVIEGPGLEIAGVTGRIDVDQGRIDDGKCALTAWVARADGSVAGGLLARRGNIVCITFEFTVLELTATT